MYSYVAQDKCIVEGSKTYKVLKFPFRGGVIGQEKKVDLDLKNDGVYAYREDILNYQLRIYYSHRSGMGPITSNGEKERVEVFKDGILVETVIKFTDTFGHPANFTMNSIGNFIATKDYESLWESSGGDQYLSWRIEPRQGLSLTSGSLLWTPGWKYEGENWMLGNFPKQGPGFREIKRTNVYQVGGVVGSYTVNIK